MCNDKKDRRDLDVRDDDDHTIAYTTIKKNEVVSRDTACS
jgi:cation transport regulator ChaB